jgi:hypothetical protein
VGGNRGAIRNQPPEGAGHLRGGKVPGGQMTLIALLVVLLVVVTAIAVGTVWSGR